MVSTGKYNVRVIQFKRPQYSVYAYVEENGRTVLEQWFAENEAPDVVYAAMYALWDIYEAGGIFSIRASVIDLEDGFYGLVIPRKGGFLACPIFCCGPFDEQTEITFLAGARWDDKLKRVRPFSAKGTAEENLDILLQKPNRRRRG